MKLKNLAEFSVKFQINDLEKWRKRNLYYYQDLESLYCFLVQPEVNVLEVGSGLGYLLNSVQPKLGLGVDIDTQAVEDAKRRFPNLEFEVDNAEELNLNQTFDYVLMANTVSYIQSIQKCLQNVRKASQLSTRLVLTFHNPAWEPVLKFAALVRQRMPLPPLNWLSFEDIESLLSLEEFEVIYHGKRMLFPKRIPLISRLFNKVLAPLPGINRLCLTEYIVARPRSNNIGISRNTSQMTCSVIIPARNEAGNIENCIRRMPRLGKHTEIIFVEGHSEDRTGDEIQRVQAQYSQQWDIKFYRQVGKGKGDAVRQGFSVATGDILIILDSDLTVRPEDLVYFFEAVASGCCELANGCRLVYPVSSVAMPWLNRMANRFFAWLLSYLLNTKIKDSLCGTKAISKENYLKIAANRSYFGDFDPFGDFDLLFGAAKLSLHIKDIPVRYMPRTYGSSKFSILKKVLY